MGLRFSQSSTKSEKPKWCGAWGRKWGRRHGGFKGGFDFFLPFGKQEGWWGRGMEALLGGHQGTGRERVRVRWWHWPGPPALTAGSPRAVSVCPSCSGTGGFLLHSGGWVVGRTTCSRCPRRGDMRTRARAALPPRLPGAPPAPRLDGLCEGQGPAAASRLLPIVIICFLNHIKEEKPSLGTKRQIITIKLKCKLSCISVHTWVKAA